MKLYTNQQLLPHNIAFPSDQLSSFQVSWDADQSLYYTLIIYDVDAPSPSNPSASPFLHALIVNIPGNKIEQGNQLIPYTMPNPPSGEHRYVIALYRQSYKVPINTISKRENFDLINFVNNNQLILVENETLVADSKFKDFYLYSEKELGSNPINSQVTFNSKYPLIIPNSLLSDREMAFCECVIDVGTKQPGKCNLEKAWFEERDEHVCYNPFAVCAKSVGTTSRNCKENFNSQQMTPAQLDVFNALFS